MNTKNSSLDVSNIVVGFDTAVTLNGLSSGTLIDFTGAGISSSQIIGAIETSLENTNDGSGNGLLSGSSGARVANAGASESRLLLFTDGGSGAAEDVAMVIYSEGSSADSDYSSELTLTNVLKSVDLTILTHDNFFG